jgi:DNA-directed RNA polymerase subunit RPC12/RpoP
MGTGTKGAAPLECPECGGKIIWDGAQYVCLTCPWKEHDARPPSDRKIPAPKKKDDEKK